MSVRGNRMKIIAHRGASADAPENTRAAIRLAWEQQADGVEIDVHLTRDRQVVVIHDETARRTAGVACAVGATDWEELRALDVGRWKGARWTGERIPRLADILQDHPPGRELFVEIKSGRGILEPLEELARRRRVPDQAIVWVSFSEEVLSAARAALPGQRLFWNVPYRQWNRDLAAIVQQAVQSGFSGIGLEAARGPEPDEVRLARDGGLALFIWTVDDPSMAAELKARGVDYLVTNRPGWLRSQLDATG